MRLIHPKSFELVECLNTEGKLEIKGHQLLSGHPDSYNGAMTKEKYWVEDSVAISSKHINNVTYKIDEPVKALSPLEYIKYTNFIKREYPNDSIPVQTYEEYLEDTKIQRYTIYLSFTDIGALRLAKVTSENINRDIAIVIDGLVFAKPVILEGIYDGEAAFYSCESEDEAKKITDILSRSTQGHSR
jgi:hypothetical protein